MNVRQYDNVLYSPGHIEPCSKPTFSYLISLRLKTIGVALLWRKNCFRSTPKGVLTAHTDMAVGCKTAVHSTVRNVEGLVAMGGRSSVVRELEAQARELGSIASGFPVLFHIPFSACI